MSTVVVYPGAIARACSVVDESPAFRDLPRPYLWVVMRLVKKINLSNLSAPIVASRATIAREADTSIGTVERVIRWLEDHGMVEREQKARAGLRGSSSPLTPTALLLDALLLTNTPPSPRDIAAQAMGSAPSPAGQSYPQDKLSSPLKTAGSISGEYNNLIENNRNGSFSRIQNLTIPSDLAWLCRKGVRATGVLSLMRKAKAVNQRLSDVIAVARQYLEPLSGRSIYAYVVALLAKNKDYGAVRKQEAQEHHNRELVEHLKRKAEGMEGRRFSSRRSGAVFTVEGGWLRVEKGGSSALRPFDEAFLDAINAGKLCAV
jgi:hypothetical protein